MMTVAQVSKRTGQREGPKLGKGTAGILYRAFLKLHTSNGGGSMTENIDKAGGEGTGAFAKQVIDAYLAHL